MAAGGLEKRSFLSLGEEEQEEEEELVLSLSRTDQGRRTGLFSALAVFVVGLLVFSSIRAPSCWRSGPRPTPSADSYAAPTKFEHGIFVPSSGDIVVSSSQSIQSRSPATEAPPDATTSAAAPAKTVLNCFEVDQPVLLPGGAAESDGSSATGDGGPSSGSCTVLLMRRDFAWSYNDPFIGKLSAGRRVYITLFPALRLIAQDLILSDVLFLTASGNYTPPSCQFNRVVLNFTVVSHGRQFDRLALMYFGDTEVCRSTPLVPSLSGWRPSTAAGLVRV